VAEITFFVALPFDFVDSSVAAGEPIDCSSPDAAIQRAQGLWKVFGHAERIDADRWRVPADLPARGQAYDLARDRANIGLDQQIGSDGDGLARSLGVIRLQQPFIVE
jgi:hypothetical protein